jgi:DNA-binding transcriptional LysR family regulator
MWIFQASSSPTGHGPGDRVRIGSPDNLMSSWLPSVLRTFAATHPTVSIAVIVGYTRPLIESMNRGSLDIVIGSRCRGDQPGHLLWREPLVWAYARDGVIEREMPVPLALFPEPCPYREAALAALARAGRDWRITLVSPSFDVIVAAAEAEFGVVPISQSLLTAQLQTMGPAEGLPDLPEVEVMVFTSGRNGMLAVTELTDEIVRVARL